MHTDVIIAFAAGSRQVCATFTLAVTSANIFHNPSISISQSISNQQALASFRILHHFKELFYSFFCGGHRNLLIHSYTPSLTQFFPRFTILVHLPVMCVFIPFVFCSLHPSLKRSKFLVLGLFRASAPHLFPLGFISQLFLFLQSTISVTVLDGCRLSLQSLAVSPLLLLGRNWSVAFRFAPPALLLLYSRQGESIWRDNISL